MERQDKPSFWSRISNANHVQPSNKSSQSQATAASGGNNGQLRKGRFSSLFLGKDRSGSDKSRNHSNESVIEEKRSGTVEFGSLELPEADRDPWIEAYEKLRDDEKEGKLVNAYEKILTNRATATISGTGYVDDVQADAPNQFEGLTEADRVDMMKATLSPVLERAKQEKTWKNVALYADTLIANVGKGVGDALQAHPPAAMAWSGICLLLPIIVKPIKEEEKVTEGLEYVMNRMDWYIPLTKVVLQREWPGNVALQQHRSSLRDNVVTLFTSLLKFEMECACRAYGTHPVVCVLGDIVSLSGWGDKLEDIKKHGEAIEKDLQSYGINTLAEYSMQTASNTNDILAEVKKFNEAATRAEKTRAAERRDNLAGLISRFGATTYRDQMEFNPQRHPGTCEWFCRHSKYTSWLNSTKNDLLLVTAEPGCGKSVLARFLIETELPSQREDAVIGYFFFKDNPVQNNLINALSAILHQLLNLCPDVLDTLGTNIKKLSPELLKDCGQLWGLIEDVCENLLERTVFCVFDAFDECNSDGRERLLRLLGSHQFSKKRIRFLVTSRGYPAIVTSFRSITESLMRLEGEGKSEKDQLQNEIDIVFRHRVESLIKDRRLGRKVSELLHEQLHTKGKGQRTYLWVRLVFKFLDNNYPLNLDGWRDLLDQLPEDVPGAYEKLLSNVRSTDRRHVETLLRLVYVAEEPLSLSAANIAVNLRGKYSLDSLDDLGLSDEESFKEWVINTCGFFITDYDGKLFFIHQTAKEFLSPVERTFMDKMSSENKKGLSVQTMSPSTEHLPNGIQWRGSLNTEEEAHFVMTECCLANLALYRQRSETKELEELIEDAWEHDQTVYSHGIQNLRHQLYFSNGFFEYSSTYWPKHFRAAKLHLADISTDGVEILNAHQTAKQSLFQAYRLIMTYPTRSVWLLTSTMMAEIQAFMKQYRYGRLLTAVSSNYIAKFGKGSDELEAWPSTTLLSVRCSPTIFACLFGFPLFIQEWLSGNTEENAAQDSEQRCHSHSCEVETKLALVNAIFTIHGNSQEMEYCISEVLLCETKLALEDRSRLERLLWFGNKILDTLPGYLDDGGMKLLVRDQLKKFEVKTRLENKHGGDSIQRKPRRAETT
ncbi:NACHT_N domain-containing protein [Trichoderma simmonsii]|uniref:NACHT_N domain-containing protein n=1 Tax=Trichoderma simmonsii TaxID=1491479 RepID=A0A8G0LGV5_9HYPO|nr:NACHT_N domain-containing protein [Trichoderma simmonsii]